MAFSSAVKSGLATFFFAVILISSHTEGLPFSNDLESNSESDDVTNFITELPVEDKYFEDKTLESNVSDNIRGILGGSDETTITNEIIEVNNEKYTFLDSYKNATSISSEELSALAVNITSNTTEASSETSDEIIDSYHSGINLTTIGFEDTEYSTESYLGSDEDNEFKSNEESSKENGFEETKSDIGSQNWLNKDVNIYNDTSFINNLSDEKNSKESDSDSDKKNAFHSNEDSISEDDESDIGSRNWLFKDINIYNDTSFINNLSDEKYSKESDSDSDKKNAFHSNEDNSSEDNESDIFSINGFLNNTNIINDKEYSEENDSDNYEQNAFMSNDESHDEKGFEDDESDIITQNLFPSDAFYDNEFWSNLSTEEYPNESDEDNGFESRTLKSFEEEDESDTSQNYALPNATNIFNGTDVVNNLSGKENSSVSISDNNKGDAYEPNKAEVLDSKTSNILTQNFFMNNGNFFVGTNYVDIASRGGNTAENDSKRGKEESRVEPNEESNFMGGEAFNTAHNTFLKDTKVLNGIISASEPKVYLTDTLLLTTNATNTDNNLKPVEQYKTYYKRDATGDENKIDFNNATALFNIIKSAMNSRDEAFSRLADPVIRDPLIGNLRTKSISRDLSNTLDGKNKKKIVFNYFNHTVNTSKF